MLKCGRFSLEASGRALQTLVLPLPPSLLLSALIPRRFYPQGAYLVNNPSDVSITFWASLPSQIYWPMMVLATLAAIVASQAVITGTFSILRQVGLRVASWRSKGGETLDKTHK